MRTVSAQVHFRIVFERHKAGNGRGFFASDFHQMCSFIFRRPFVTAGGGKKKPAHVWQNPVARGGLSFLRHTDTQHQSQPCQVNQVASFANVSSCLTKQTVIIFELYAPYYWLKPLYFIQGFFFRQWLALTQSTAVKQAINYTPWETFPSYYPKTISHAGTLRHFVFKYFKRLNKSCSNTAFSCHDSNTKGWNKLETQFPVSISIPKTCSCIFTSLNNNILQELFAMRSR